MKKTALILLFALGVCACSRQETGPGATESAPQAKGPAPDFDLANVAGGKINSADIKGKVAIIDFWATWCVPCIQEIPNFNKIHANYGSKGVQMLAVTLESGSLDDIKPKVKELKMEYPVVVGNDAVVEGFGGLIGFPTTFVVSKDWKIYKKYFGMTPNKIEKIEKDIATLLGEKTE